MRKQDGVFNGAAWPGLWVELKTKSTGTHTHTDPHISPVEDYRYAYQTRLWTANDRSFARSSQAQPLSPPSSVATETLGGEPSRICASFRLINNDKGVYASESCAA